MLYRQSLWQLRGLLVVVLLGAITLYATHGAAQRAPKNDAQTTERSVTETSQTPRTIQEQVQQIDQQFSDIKTVLSGLQEDLSDYSNEVLSPGSGNDGEVRRKVDADWGKLMGVIDGITSLSKESSTFRFQISQALTAVEVDIGNLKKLETRTQKQYPDIMNSFITSGNKLKLYEKNLEQIYNDVQQVKTILYEQEQVFPFFNRANRLKFIVEAMGEAVGTLQQLVGGLENVAQQIDQQGQTISN